MKLKDAVWDEKGISLVELVCSLAVLSIITGTLLNMYIFSAQVEAKASAREHALSISEEIIGFYELAEDLSSFESNLSANTPGAASGWERDTTDAGVIKYDKYYDYKWNKETNGAFQYYKGTIIIDDGTGTSVKSNGTYTKEDCIIRASQFTNNTLIISGSNPINLTYGEVQNLEKDAIGDELVILIEGDTDIAIKKHIDSQVNIPVKILLCSESHELEKEDFHVINPGAGGVTITEKVQVGVDQNLQSISIEFFKKDDESYEVLTKQDHKYGGI